MPNIMEEFLLVLYPFGLQGFPNHDEEKTKTMDRRNIISGADSGSIFYPHSILHNSDPSPQNLHFFIITDYHQTME